MIFGDRIRQARELRGFTQLELADRVGVTQARIAHIEGGFKDASEDLIAAVAIQTGFPISFFSRGPSIEFPIGSLLFRAHCSMTRKAMVEAHRHAQTVFELFKELAQHTNEIPVGIRPLGLTPAEAARTTRQAIGIAPNGPLLHLTRTLEKKGVVVLVLPDIRDGDSFSLWAGPDFCIPVIAIAAGRPGDRVRMNLAHELGHLVLHSPTTIRSKDTEKDAYEFAAELLMPKDAIRHELTAPLTLLSVSKLKPRWGVSMQALIRRAYDLNTVTERQYRYLFQQLSAKGWRIKEPSNLDVPAEKPRRLRKMAELVYGDPIKYETLAAKADLTIRYLREVMSFYDEASSSSPRDVRSGQIVRFRRRG